VYLLQALGMDEMLTGWFSVFPASLSTMLQLWRLVTYQFLHGGIMHILFNMLGLFFLGPMLERNWGSRKFLVFYLSCGIAGGLFYTLLVTIRFLPIGQMIGASGAILGMLSACAILFPHFVVFILVFPVPIRIAAIAFTAIYLIAVISRGVNAGGEAAHLAGMVTGAVYVFSQSWRAEWRLKIRSVRWEKKIAAERRLQVEVDRILEKVHKQGVHGLTWKEKRILRQATKIEQMRNRL
jgi:membrane associated rhomboid family serine protease